MTRAENEFFSNSNKVLFGLAMVYHVGKHCYVLDLFDECCDVSGIPRCTHLLGISCNVHWSWASPFLEDSGKESLKSAFRHSHEEVDKLFTVSGTEFILCNLNGNLNLCSLSCQLTLFAFVTGFG